MVFGKSTGFSATLNLLDLNGVNGFAINGIKEGDGSGYSVSSAGDTNNIIEGKAGNDTLTGNGGQDQFVIRSGDRSDTITDFGGVGKG